MQLRKTDHVMELRHPEKYKRTRSLTEGFKNSSILFVQDLLNKEEQYK